MSKDIETKTVDLLDKLDALVTQYTPEVIDVATSAVTITAISNLLYGLLGFAAAYTTWWLTKKVTIFFVNKKEQGCRWSNWEIGYGLSSGAGIFASGLFALISVWALFDLWNWVAIFNPQLAIVHRVLGL